MKRVRLIVQELLQKRNAELADPADSPLLYTNQRPKMCSSSTVALRLTSGISDFSLFLPASACTTACKPGIRRTCEADSIFQTLT